MSATQSDMHMQVYDLSSTILAEGVSFHADVRMNSILMQTVYFQSNTNPKHGRSQYFSYEMTPNNEVR